MMKDRFTTERIGLLHPIVRRSVTDIIDECNAALTGRARVRITQGLRSNDEQKKLYAQGRTSPGKKVTNARPGQSIHNYGLAVDICLIIDEKEASWDTTKDWDGDRQADWMEVVTIFKRHGWHWGGDWRTFKDMPHFEKTFGHTWRTLISKPKDKNGYVIF